jgi:hypothetical protein
VYSVHTHCTENRIYVFPKKELRGLSPNSYIHVSVSDLYIPRIGPHIWLLQNRQTILEIYKSLTDIVCRNWEAENYNSLLEITRLHTVSFLGIHKWEPDIYTGFSPALHLHCTLLLYPVHTVPVRQPEGPGIPAVVLLLEELVRAQREEVWPHPHYNRIQCFVFIIYILEKPAETQTRI